MQMLSFVSHFSCSVFCIVPYSQSRCNPYIATISQLCHIKYDIQQNRSHLLRGSPANFKTIYRLNQLDYNFHSRITFTRSDLDDTGISAVTVCIFRAISSNIFCGISMDLVFFLASCCFGRNLCYRIEEACHLTSSVKSGRKIF